MTTAYEAMALGEEGWGLFTAVHELGHAVAALGTGRCTVEESVIEPSAEAEAWTNFSWKGKHPYLTAVHGGHLAQERWIVEQGLWTPLRAKALRQLALHDYAAIAKTGAAPEVVAAAEQAATEHLDRNWAGLLTAAEALSQTGRISGPDIAAHLAAQRAPYTPTRPTVSARHNPEVTQTAAPPPDIAVIAVIAATMPPASRAADTRPAAPILPSSLNSGKGRGPVAAAPHVLEKPTKLRGPGLERSINTGPGP